jgi:hypothetical protein
MLVDDTNALMPLVGEHGTVFVRALEIVAIIPTSPTTCRVLLRNEPADVVIDVCEASEAVNAACLHWTLEATKRAEALAEERYGGTGLARPLPRSVR